MLSEKPSRRETVLSGAPEFESFLTSPSRCGRKRRFGTAYADAGDREGVGEAAAESQHQMGQMSLKIRLVRVYYIRGGIMFGIVVDRRKP
jgi:hypothetical protein